MINRVLIRIKVIQILYAFLLVEKQFSIESQPSAPTKEKRFAYSLYLSMLLLFVRISEKISRRGGDRPLADTRFIRKLMSDDTLKSLDNRCRMDGSFDFSPIVDDLASIISESALYKNYLKKKSSKDDLGEERIWKEIFETIIMPSSLVNAIVSKRENYTLRGVERMKGMMEETFANFMTSQDNYDEAVNSLHESLRKARELYLRLLALPMELTHLRELDIDERRNRFPGSQNAISGLRFVENGLVAALNSDDELTSAVEKISWLSEEPLMMHRLLKAILESDVYREYIEMPETDFAQDCEFWKRIFRQVIFCNEDFLECLEDKSVFWNDDIEIIGTFVIKTIKRYEDGVSQHPLLDQFKDDEDARFGDDLTRYVLKNKELYRMYIDEALKNGSWEPERLAFMDVVIMETALAEILNFPKIPLSASINEYIEIAKSYSTAKSGVFVNGILGSVVNRLKMEGKLFGKA